MLLENCDRNTREKMLQEVKADIGSNQLYFGKYLNEEGVQRYPDILIEAIEKHDITWFTKALSVGLMKTQTERRTKKGISTVKVPVTAPQMLAEGEFNRYYCRGLCLRAIEEGIPKIEVYRAKAVQNARSASEAKIGHLLEAQSLLDDLRENIGVDTALGLPAGPNSGLSVRIPKSD